MTARHRDGRVWTYPHPDASSQVLKLWESVAAVRTRPVSGSGTAAMDLPLCGLETARPHVSVVEALERSGTAPFAYGTETVRITETSGGRLHWVEGLADAMRAAYEAGEMPTLPGWEG